MVRAAKKDRFSLKYILILAAAVILLTQSGWMTQKDVHYVPVRIHKGDTVWDIAATAAGDSEDVRHIVWDIVKTNNLFIFNIAVLLCRLMMLSKSLPPVY